MEDYEFHHEYSLDVNSGLMIFLFSVIVGLQKTWIGLISASVGHNRHWVKIVSKVRPNRNSRRKLADIEKGLRPLHPSKIKFYWYMWWRGSKILSAFSLLRPDAVSIIIIIILLSATSDKWKASINIIKYFLYKIIIINFKTKAWRSLLQ